MKVLLIAVLATGCSSHYLPQRQQTVAMTMRNGQLAYERDGRSYGHGFLGGGLAQAVQGVPAAEAAARKYRSRLGAGLLLSVAGAICVPTALGVAVARDSGGDDPGPYYIALGCLAASVVGTGVAVSAIPYQYDAVNIFNDAVRSGGEQQPKWDWPAAPAPNLDESHNQ